MTAVLWPRNYLKRGQLGGVNSAAAAVRLEHDHGLRFALEWGEASILQTQESGKPSMRAYGQLLNDFIFGDAVAMPWRAQSAPRGPMAAATALNGSSFGFAAQDREGRAYNEEAFQYFLEIERKRSELSNRQFLLMLVDFKTPGVQARVEPAAAEQLFDVLALCLRETDFIGWYRDGRVAGAVLTQDGEADADLCDTVRDRVGAALRARLDRALADRLQIRVYQLSRQAQLRAE